MRKVDFGALGVRACYPMQLEEMRALPEQLGLEEVGMYAAGFNWFVDYCVFPLAMAAAKIGSRFAINALSGLFIWGMRRFSRPPFEMAFKLEAEGETGGAARSLAMTVRHEDGYILTAIPTVACLLQYLEGALARPGLHLMAHLVDPARLMSEIARMGAAVADSGP